MYISLKENVGATAPSLAFELSQKILCNVKHVLYNMVVRKELIFIAQVNFRVDDTVKAKAENACAAMGLTLSSAINIFLTKVTNERRIPFEISADLFYSDEHIAMLEKRTSDIQEEKNMHEHELVEVEQ